MIIDENIINSAKGQRLNIPPHKLCELLNNSIALYGIDKLQMSIGNKFDFEWFFQLINKSVHFDFGRNIPDAEHIDFGFDLKSNSLLTLPFKVTLFTCDFMPPLLCSFVNQNFFEAFSFNTFLSSNMRICLPHSQYSFSNGEEDLVLINHSTLGIQSENIESNFLASLSVNVLHGFVSMLMSKGVDQQVIPAPTRLNAKREKIGRAPIGERRIIRITASRPQSGNDDASKLAVIRRMHWRRGHLRKVRDDLIVPVAPTIVNATGDAKPIAKQYVFMKNGNAREG